MRYLKAKWDHHVDEHLKQLTVVTEQLYNEKHNSAAHDAWMQPRIDFMYNHLDFHNSRARTRLRFIKTMHKKSTLEDIGGLLDKFTLDSKARIADYYDPKKHALE
jgi:DNA-directed RNA polymerase sigma subunit (sigma70/sigma32)